MRCQIVYIGKARNGKPKYWCTEHHAPVFFVDGTLDATCQYVQTVRENRAVEEMFAIDPQEFPGGIALWGALPAVYDTTRFPMDFGIHVHARKEVGGKKVYDKTFVKTDTDTVEFDAVAAVSYTFANILNLPIEYVECPRCGYPHLDKDWFSINPHKKHLCAGCGREFFDSKISVGNPIIKAKKFFGDNCVQRQVISPHRTLAIKQSDFPYGLAIWGSNTALLWTSPKTEEYGIHVHAYATDSREPTIDETFDKVIIDGAELPVEQVRLLMIQQALPFLEQRIATLQCPTCGSAVFESGTEGCKLTTTHICQDCQTEFKSRKKVVSNPLVATLAGLEKFAVNPRKEIDLLSAYPTLKGW